MLSTLNNGMQLLNHAMPLFNHAMPLSTTPCFFLNKDGITTINVIHIKQRDAITQPRHAFNGSLAKPPLKLRQG